MLGHASRATALPPLNSLLARDLVSRTRVAKLLAGYRDRAAADLDAIDACLIQVSQMVCELPELEELDINPLLADERGVIALDARVKLRSSAVVGKASDRLAILPYPALLEETVELNGRRVSLRPIRPEDEPLLRGFYARATPADMRLRFFLARREVPHSELARYSQIDYDREMTFVALRPDDAAEGLLGEARAVCDPDNQRAEFAIQVATHCQRRGLGANHRAYGTRVPHRPQRIEHVRACRAHCRTGRRCGPRPRAARLAPAAGRRPVRQPARRGS